MTRTMKKILCSAVFLGPDVVCCRGGRPASRKGTGYDGQAYVPQVTPGAGKFVKARPTFMACALISGCIL